MTPRFAPGDAVRVSERDQAGHVRTPRYIRGKRGIVERICGAFRNPEQLAYGVWDGPAVALYRVRFQLNELWPTEPASRDSVDVEIYEHWLEPEARA